MLQGEAPRRMENLGLQEASFTPRSKTISVSPGPSARGPVNLMAHPTPRRSDLSAVGVYPPGERPVRMLGIAATFEHRSSKSPHPAATFRRPSRASRSVLLCLPAPWPVGMSLSTRHRCNHHELADLLRRLALRLECLDQISTIATLVMEGQLEELAIPLQWRSA